LVVVVEKEVELKRKVSKMRGKGKREGKKETAN